MIQGNKTSDDSIIELGLGAATQYSYFTSKSAILSKVSESDRLSLQEVQSLPVQAPMAFAHITIPPVVSHGNLTNPQRDLLAVASHYFEGSDAAGVEGGSYIGLSSVWERIPSTSNANGSTCSAPAESWQILQGIYTAGAVDLEAFEINDIQWIAVANVSKI